MFLPKDKIETEFKILGIDPGTMFCGVSVLTVQYPLFSIKDVDTFTIVADETNRYLPEIDNPHPIPANRLFYLHDSLVNLLNREKPKIVGIEAPFYNRLRPGAYGPLSEAMQAIKRSIFDYNSNVPYHLFPPSIVKKEVGASWKASKEEMTIALKSNDVFPTEFKKIIDRLNEHEIDATAVAYALLTMLKENEVLLCLI